MLHSGQSLLHYRLDEPLGRGGMGEVWSALDTSLERQVAIKVLPTRFAADRDRLLRFEREAKLLAALNHPNIAAVYGFHQQDELAFLALEKIPGRDLAHLLTAGSLPIPEVVELGRQVSLGLEQAHQHGIIHRDLKPANILRTPSGIVKIIDFGLARSEIPVAERPSRVESSLPTRSTPMTIPGAVLGTAAYMSPEQARGDNVDRRTDLWSLGCLLFEALTHSRPFHGDTTAELLAAILRSEPDWSLLPDSTPPLLRDLIKRCLVKDPDQRWQNAGDAAFVLSGVSTDSGVAASVDPPSSVSWLRKSMVAWSAAALLAVLAAGSFFTRSRDAVPRSDSPRVVHSRMSLPANWHPRQARISPDGSTIGISADTGLNAERRVFIRHLEDHEFTELEAVLALENIRFSPDSSKVAFVQSNVAGISGDALVQAPADGSTPPALIVPWDNSWTEVFAWLSDREIVVSKKSPPRLVRIGLSTGAVTEQPLELPETQDFLVRSRTPDGNLLGTIQDWNGGYHQDPAFVEVSTGRVRRILDRGFEPAWLPPKQLYFSRRDQLLTVDYRLSSSDTPTAPRVVAAGLLSDVSATAAMFSLSDRGDLLYLEGGMVGDERHIVWLSAGAPPRDWHPIGAPIQPGSLDDSQNGKIIAWVQLSSTGLWEVWASEVDDPSPRPSIALPNMDCQDPVPSDSGTLIAVSCIGDPQRDGLYIGSFPSIENDQLRRLASHAGGRLRPTSWLDGDASILVIRSDQGISHLERLRIDAEEPTLEPIPGLSGDVASAMLSPDAQLIAFAAWDGRGYVLQVASWDGAAAGPARPVASMWRYGFDWTGVRVGDRWELVSANQQGVPQRILIDADGRATEIEPITQLEGMGSILGVSYLADGTILGIGFDARETTPATIHLITDWTSSLAPR